MADDSPDTGYRDNPRAQMLLQEYARARQKLEEIVEDAEEIQFCSNGSAAYKKRADLLKKTPSPESRRYIWNLPGMIWRIAQRTDLDRTICNIESNTRKLDEIYTSLGFESQSFNGVDGTLRVYSKSVDDKSRVLADRDLVLGDRGAVLYEFDREGFDEWRKRCSQQSWEEIPHINQKIVFLNRVIYSWTAGALLGSGILQFYDSIPWMLIGSLGGAALTYYGVKGIVKKDVKDTHLYAPKEIARGKEALYRAAEPPKHLEEMMPRYRVETEKDAPQEQLPERKFDEVEVECAPAQEEKVRKA